MARTSYYREKLYARAMGRGTTARTLKGMQARMTAGKAAYGSHGMKTMKAIKRSATRRATSRKSSKSGSGSSNS